MNRSLGNRSELPPIVQLQAMAVDRGQPPRSAIATILIQIGSVIEQKIEDTNMAAKQRATSNYSRAITEAFRGAMQQMPASLAESVQMRGTSPNATPAKQKVHKSKTESKNVVYFAVSSLNCV